MNRLAKLKHEHPGSHESKHQGNADLETQVQSLPSAPTGCNALSVRKKASIKFEAFLFNHNFPIT